MPKISVSNILDVYSATIQGSGLTGPGSPNSNCLIILQHLLRMFPH